MVVGVDWRPRFPCSLRCNLRSFCERAHLLSVQSQPSQAGRYRTTRSKKTSSHMGACGFICQHPRFVHCKLSLPTASYWGGMLFHSFPLFRPMDGRDSRVPLSPIPYLDSCQTLLYSQAHRSSKFCPYT